MLIERRYFEVRAEGRRLEGVALRYGDIAKFPWGAERFTPGAFAPLGDVILNSMHERTVPIARTGGGGLTLHDDGEALRVVAELPKTQAANDVLELVAGKVMRGLSVEFEALTERLVDNVRVIERARLAAIGVVDSPAYPASEVEARMAALANMRPASRGRSRNGVYL